MRIAFRVDASNIIGSGHVMRCLVLADELRALDYSIIFVMRPQENDLIDYVRYRGFEVKKLNIPEEHNSVQDENDYSTWLQLSEYDDAEDFIKNVDKCDFVVVDHYGINDTWELKVKNTLECPILAIDDLVRRHQVDLILDQTVDRNSFEYAQESDFILAMTGTRYALLRNDFSKFRAKQCDIANAFVTHNVLISMGAIDNFDVTSKVLNALKKRKTLLNCTVLLNSSAPHFHEVTNFINNNSHWVRHIDFTENIAELMSEHTISIGAPGSTSWERVCLGLPSIVIPLASNQEQICERLVMHNCSLSIKISEIEKNLDDCINKLIKNYLEMRNACLNLCDGRGAERVVNRISIFNKNIKLRIATSEDIEKVYLWQTIPETRRYSNNPQIPTFVEHKKWMTEKLISKNDYFYIIKINEIDIGVVRLDKKSCSIFVISIFIIPEFHGKGIASEVLSIINKLFPTISIEATVKSQNISSKKLFKKAGYKEISEELFLRDKIE